MNQDRNSIMRFASNVATGSCELLSTFRTRKDRVGSSVVQITRAVMGFTLLGVKADRHSVSQPTFSACQACSRIGGLYSGDNSHKNYLCTQRYFQYQAGRSHEQCLKARHMNLECMDRLEKIQEIYSLKTKEQHKCIPERQIRHESCTTVKHLRFLDVVEALVKVDFPREK